ncbi:MAG: flagellar motor protein MotB [Elusimicrobia bacterium]|nr:flagellar motor protein MotB [Elusimicrobiota bacterium]
MSVWEEDGEEVERQLNKSALWAVTYGDLMSYLVIFFMLLYVAAATKSVSLQMGLQGVEEQFGKESTVLNELFSRHGIQRIARFDLTEDNMRIIFSSPVLFESGRDQLKESSLPHLRRLADSLADLPNPIQIEGHTDDRALSPLSPFKSNWELSAARAFSVLRFFEKRGVPSSRLSAIGYGEFRPVKANDTPEGREANRRIEITILRRRD